MDALRSEPPDVLMLSNYMWNEQLSLRFARLAKSVRPQTLVVMGGPNLSLEEDRQREYLRQHPELDVYVLGEADFLAAEVARQFLAAGKSLEEFRRLDLPSALYRRADGTVVLNKIWPRRKTVDDIPSPWLAGILDEFFDGKLAPMIETNRGCPFTCTFCVQGTSWYTKVNYFDKERLRQEIEYIADRVHTQCPQMGILRIADSNFGMFERDVELSGFVGEAQKKYGWPTFIDATTGKNRPERIINSLEKVNGALVLYQAVQSLDDDVLRQVKRSSIKKEAYEQIMIHVRGRGLRALSDLILGLPGETLQTHLSSMNSLIDAGTNEMHNFQSMMLKGSEMETVASRTQFQFDTRFRVLPKNFGIYAGEKVFDLDEIVVATDTLPFEDYVTARKNHLICSIFFNNSWFDDAIALLERFKVKRSEWLAAMLQSIEQDQGEMRRLLDDFVRETKGELFPTAEACAAYYSEPANFQKLQEGEHGDNLMYKYRALASFFEWSQVSGVALATTLRLLVERGAEREIADFARVWEDFERFQCLKHAHGRTVEEILAPGTAVFRYDVAGWLGAAMPADTAAFRLEPEQQLEFRLSEAGERELRSALQVWSTNLKGLTKMVTRIRNVAQLRAPRRVDAVSEAIAN
jgi:hypothetical protein